MGLFAKLMYAFCIHFIIYWVFVQPFIGKELSYNDAVSYSVGAVIIIVFSTTTNVYLVTALLTGDQSEKKSSIYCVIVNMVVADMLQTLIVMPLSLLEKVSYVSAQNTLDNYYELLQSIAKILTLLQYFSMLSGALYAASLAQCCFVSFLRTWYRLPRATYKMTIYSTQFIWVYSTVLFTFSIQDWSKEWHKTYEAMVEFFVPMGIIMLSIVALSLLEWIRPPEDQVFEKDVPNRVLYALTVVFFVFRAPVSVFRLANVVLSYEMEKLKYISINLYYLKCCTNPILLFMFDKSIQTMYTRLHDKISKCLLRCHGRDENEARVEFESSNQSVNVGLTLDEEETELLP